MVVDPNGLLRAFGDGDPLPIEQIGHRRFRLLADHRVITDDFVLTVPAGTVSDLSSVPRLLWPALAPFELGRTAPWVHDLLYQRGGRPGAACEPPRTFTRLEADRLFLQLMAVEDVPWWRRTLAYRAVRLAGWGAWRATAPARAGW